MCLILLYGPCVTSTKNLANLSMRGPFHYFRFFFTFFRVLGTSPSPKYLSRISAVSTVQVLPCTIRHNWSSPMPVSLLIRYLVLPQVLIYFLIFSIITLTIIYLNPLISNINIHLIDAMYYLRKIQHDLFFSFNLNFTSFQKQTVLFFCKVFDRNHTYLQ